MSRNQCQRIEKLSVLLLGCVLLVGPGCAYKKAKVQGLQIGGLGIEQLKRSDYRVIGPASGKSCAKYIGLWPIPIAWVQGEGTSGTALGIDARSRAEKGALYNAIESVAGADALLLPRFHEEGMTYGIWYKRSCVQVDGKAISVKVDQEVTK